MIAFAALASTLALACPQNLASGIDTPAATTQLITVDAKRKDQLRAVLRWLRPGSAPMIAIGSRAQLRSP